MSQLAVEVAVASAIAVFEAQKRIPADLADHSFFGKLDLWQYIAITDDKTCETCLDYDTRFFLGDDLRLEFPDLKVIGEDMILAKVHITLWGQDTCRCVLQRITEPTHYIPIMDVEA